MLACLQVMYCSWATSLYSYCQLCCFILLFVVYSATQSVAINDVMTSPSVSSGVCIDSIASRHSTGLIRSNDLVSKQMLAYNFKHNLSTFRMATKEHLFPVFKFFTHSKDLVYCTDPNSAAQIVLSHTEINPEQYEDCWNTFQGFVRSDISRKRNNIVGQLKRKFYGMFSFWLMTIHIVMSHLQLCINLYRVVVSVAERSSWDSHKSYFDSRLTSICRIKIHHLP